MKKFRSLFLILLTALVFSAPAFAQAKPATRIALVDTDFFYDQKEGITKILNAYKQLEVEFKPSKTELETLASKLRTLETEIKAITDQSVDPNNRVPIDRDAARAKADEVDRLQRDLKFKQEDANRRYASREEAVLGPIINDIGDALGDFAKQKGFTMVFDLGKLAQQRLIVYWTDTPNITKEFIQFYNSKPAAK